MRKPRLIGAGVLMGLVTGAVALGVGQLVSGIVNPAASPIITVGQASIDATPEWLKSFAIRTFGSKDKLALLSGISLTLAIIAVGLGIASVRRLRVGLAGLGFFGAIGVLTALTRPTAEPIDALPAIAGALAAAFVLFKMHTARLAPSTGSRGKKRAGPGNVAEPKPSGFDRRRFLVASGWGAAAAVVASGAGRMFTRRFEATASRAEVRIPPPASPLPSLATGTDLSVSGLSPFITPTGEFYRVDTALLAPSVRAESWKLFIHGMVDKEISLTYPELLKRSLIERDITLCCVSNEVGGHFISNARWIGAPLKDILEEAGVRPRATQLVSRSVDGFTIGTPTAVLMDGRDAMLAVAMNGEPLPIAHGFPVRMLVPGLYGYVSATKWVIDMELTTFGAYDAYWVKRGWSQQGPIKTESRIDTPQAFAKLRAGEVAVAGIAWAQHTGIASVQVRVDDGAWQEGQLFSQDTIDTWRQWVYRWNASPGAHRLAVRASDQTGYVQTGAETRPFPSGATGWHTIDVQVA